MIKIKYYKSDGCIFVSDARYNHYQQQWKINGVPAELTFSSKWFKYSGIESIDCITSTMCEPDVNFRWEVDNKVCDGLADVISQEQSLEWRCEDDYEWYMGGDLHKLTGLYKRVFDKGDEFDVELLEGEDYELVFAGDIKSEDVSDPVKAKYSVTWGYGGKKANLVDLLSITKYKDIDLFMTPEILLAKRPCSISVDDTYRLIRSYVNQNINGHYAKVTSDYEFCFTVKRLVHHKPILDKRELKTTRGKSYRPPRFKTTTRDSDMIEIFEMCPSKPYSNYTKIEAFKGNDIEDLKSNIDLYLEELIGTINMSVVECEHCSGAGQIVKSFRNMNG